MIMGERVLIFKGNSLGSGSVFPKPMFDSSNLGNPAEYPSFYPWPQSPHGPTAERSTLPPRRLGGLAGLGKGGALVS